MYIVDHACRFSINRVQIDAIQLSHMQRDILIVPSRPRATVRYFRSSSITKHSYVVRKGWQTIE